MDYSATDKKCKRNVLLVSTFKSIIHARSGFVVVKRERNGTKRLVAARLPTLPRVSRKEGRKGARARFSNS